MEVYICSIEFLRCDNPRKIIYGFILLMESSENIQRKHIDTLVIK